MELIINDRIIDTPVVDILKDIRLKTGGRFLKDIDSKAKGNNVRVTCPWHKDGMESDPSCDVLSVDTDPDLTFGTVHCFACGESTNLQSLVSRCLNISYKDAENYLSENYGNTYALESSIDFDDEIVISNEKEHCNVLDESILVDYDFYHPYMWKRNLSKEVVDRFRVGYNKDKQTITFPVWDEKDRLVMITQRSVNSKKFYIPEDVEKPVYLLNDIIKEGITRVVVTESQINCLTSWGFGYPAIALFGTGSDHQYEILNKSGIRVYDLMFDGDEAGRKGARRFIKNIRKDVWVNDIVMPRGKDVNDLTKEEFEKLIKSA